MVASRRTCSASRLNGRVAWRFRGPSSSMHGDPSSRDIELMNSRSRLSTNGPPQHSSISSAPARVHQRGPLRRERGTRSPHARRAPSHTDARSILRQRSVHDSTRTIGSSGLDSFFPSASRLKEYRGWLRPRSGVTRGVRIGEEVWRARRELNPRPPGFFQRDKSVIENRATRDHLSPTSHRCSILAELRAPSRLPTSRTDEFI